MLFARHGEKPWAALRPLVARGSAELLRAQLAAQGSALALDVAGALVGAKLANQARLLKYYQGVVKAARVPWKPVSVHEGVKS